MVENKGQPCPENGNPRGLEATWRGPATRQRQSPVNRVEKALPVVESWRWKRHMMDIELNLLRKADCNLLNLKKKT